MCLYIHPPWVNFECKRNLNAANQMSLNWWDKRCFKCSENSQWENKKLIPFNCHGQPRRRISATSGWLPKLLGTFQGLLHHSYAERDKSRSDREINFFQRFPEVRLINKCGHAISYNLFKEIETEIALKVIIEQTLNRVLIPDECNQPNNPQVAPMVVECTFSGARWIWSLSWSKTPRWMS